MIFVKLKLGKATFAVINPLHQKLKGQLKSKA